MCDQTRDGTGVLVYHTISEQGFAARSYGQTDRRLVSIEALTLVQIPS